MNRLNIGRFQNIRIDEKSEGQVNVCYCGTKKYKISMIDEEFTRIVIIMDGIN